jgi:hypothetical protein
MDQNQTVNDQDDRRVKIHNKLVDVLGSNKVYFQPPSTTKLEYPCIVYSLSNLISKYAENKMYVYNRSYEVILIHQKPYNGIKDKMLTIDKCRFNRVYVSDNLYHYAYTIYE